MRLFTKAEALSDETFYFPENFQKFKLWKIKLYTKLSLQKYGKLYFSEMFSLVETF